jgi:hypothetical protein
VKEKILKLISSVAFLLLFLGLSVQNALAGFGVSPAIIKNEYLKPGSYFVKEIVLSRSDPIEDLEIVVEADLQEMNQWITFEPGNKFIFKKGENIYRMKAIFDIPQDAPYKRYSGAIRVKAHNIEDPEQGGVSVVKGARLEVNLVTTEISLADLLVRAITPKGDVKPGELLEISLLIENKGNTSASPRAEIAITDLNNKPLETIESDAIDSIPEMETKEVFARFRPSVSQGEYFGTVKVFLGSKVLREENVVFRILGAVPQGEKKVATSIGDIVKKISIPKKIVLPLAIGLLIAAALISLTVLALKSKDKNRKIILFASAGGILLISLTLGITLLVMSLLNKNNQNPAPVAQEENEQVISEKTEVVPEVAGAETSNPNVPKIIPLVVENSEGEKIYNLYEQPDLNSKIVYSATEGEQFSVLEEVSRWYRVELPIGLTGWLPKENVKSVD